MKYVELLIDDTYLLPFQDGRFVPGAGAVEIELARIIREYANEVPGLER